MPLGGVTLFFTVVEKSRFKHISNVFKMLNVKPRNELIRMINHKSIDSEQDSRRSMG
jgi:hypothetical protein